MANNFSADANCVALWKFDNDVNDSKGGNDLTEVNTPTYDAGDKKEGSHSIDFETDSDEHCTIADGSLDAGFPSKNGVTSSFSICAWVKLESLASTLNDNIAILQKWWPTAYEFYVDYNDDKVALKVTGTAIKFGTALTTGIWYHVACTYDIADDSARIRIWDDNAQTQLGSDVTGTVGTVGSGTETLYISFAAGSQYWDGRMDEIVMFKDVLTATPTTGEIDLIRAGTFGPAVGISIPIVMHHRKQMRRRR